MKEREDVSFLFFFLYLIKWHPRRWVIHINCSLRHRNIRSDILLKYPSKRVLMVDFIWDEMINPKEFIRSINIIRVYKEANIDDEVQVV